MYLTTVGGGTKSRLLKELGTFINNQVVDIEVECNEEIGKSKCEVLSETEGVENIYPQYSSPQANYKWAGFVTGTRYE